MQLTSLQDLFADELRDLYSAENQIIKALPMMAAAASSPDLKTAFNEHLEQTREHVSRLQQVFDEMGETPGGKLCKGMQGLLQEGQEFLGQQADPIVKDAGLISMAQRVEHYEIAGYGSVRTYADRLGEDDASKLLQKTLDEEGETDKKLTKLAERGGINKQAASR